MTKNLANWFFSHDTGASSKFMAVVHLGGEPDVFRYPHDENDMHRCLSLVERCPEVRESFAKISSSCLQWGRIIPQWDDLRSTYLEHGMRAMGDKLRELLKE